mgnify:CR=1 FL=1
MSRDRNREEGRPMTKYRVELTRGEREGLLARVSWGGGGAA